MRPGRLIATAGSAGPALHASRNWMMKIRTLVLDWNGTVMDDAARALAGVNEALRDQHLPPITRAELDARYRQPIAELFRDLGLEPDRAETAWTAAVTAASAPMRPTAPILLRACRESGITVGIVSSAAEHVIVEDLRRHPHVPAPDWVDGAIDDKARCLSQRRHTAAEPMAYVGDAPHDIEAARAAGIAAIAIRGGLAAPHALEESRPDLIINDLAQLIDHLAD